MYVGHGEFVIVLMPVMRIVTRLTVRGFVEKLLDIWQEFKLTAEVNNSDGKVTQSKNHMARENPGKSLRGDIGYLGS